MPAEVKPTAERTPTIAIGARRVVPTIPSPAPVAFGYFL